METLQVDADTTHKNCVGVYVSQALKSEAARMDMQLMQDIREATTITALLSFITTCNAIDGFPTGIAP